MKGISRETEPVIKDNDVTWMALATLATVIKNNNKMRHPIPKQVAHKIIDIVDKLSMRTIDVHLIDTKYMVSLSIGSGE